LYWRGCNCGFPVKQTSIFRDLPFLEWNEYSIYTYLRIQNEIILKLLQWKELFLLMFAPNAVKCYAVCLLKRRAYESQLGSNRTVLFESENKEGSRFYWKLRKVKHLEPRISQYVATLIWRKLMKMEVYSGARKTHKDTDNFLVTVVSG
jgi:hypothetical protein